MNPLFAIQSRIVWLFAFVLAASPCLRAGSSLNDELTPSLYPHAATPSRTIGFGHVTFQPTVGYSMIPGSFLVNNLSVGVTDKFEIGFVPLLAFNSRSDYKILPFTFKMSYFESTNFDFGVSYSIFHMDFKLESQGSSNFYSAELTMPQFNFVWRFNSHNQYASSLGYRMAKITLNGKQSEDAYLGSSTFLDYIHSPGNNLHYSIGITNTVDLWTPPKKGVGLSITEERRGKFFSSPRIGIHYYDNGEHQVLLSSSFY